MKATNLVYMSILNAGTLITLVYMSILNAGTLITLVYMSILNAGTVITLVYMSILNAGTLITLVLYSKIINKTLDSTGMQDLNKILQKLKYYGNDSFVQYQDNVAEWDIGSWCW